MMDSLFIRTGLYGSIPVSSGLDVRPNISQFCAAGRSPAPVNAVSVDKSSDNMASCCSSSSSSSSSPSKFSFNQPFRSLFFGGGHKQSPKGVALDDAVLVEREVGEEGSGGSLDESEGQNGNWVLKILHVSSLWSSEKQGEVGGVDAVEREREGQNGNLPSAPSSPSSSSSSSSCVDHGYDDDYDEDEDIGCCDSCSSCCDGNDDEKGQINLDRVSFSKLLKKVPLAQAKLYAQMSYLGSLAYCIPSIKPRNLLKRHGLRFVTSSIEKREQLALAEKKGQQSDETESNDNSNAEDPKFHEQKNEQSQVSTSAAFHIAASGASYLHRQRTNLLPLRSLKKEVDDRTSNVDESDDNLASLMATTDSVTAVVAAEEEVKQAVADDLSSISSSPCEWYICDDKKTATRFFVIQGSETLASWQANLLFEPVKFEGLDVFVHRGIYEAAKGMYQQMLPEVHAHIKAHGRHAKFRFTGHSLGGSLSLLINLMLLMRGEVPYPLLLPVITFGSPCIMCGGDDLLRKLSLPKSHVQAIVMHRDIVPRAFSCNYPRPAAELLKAVNGSFRNHPCLNNQKLLYAPMGEMLILQPDEKYSPQHDLLPSGSGLYLLTCKVRDAKDAEKQLRAAMKAFLNMPHPLEILSDRSAYGNGGSILRDHDMNSYLKCVRAVIRQEVSRVRKAEGDRRHKVWWPLVTPRVSETRVILGPTLGPSSVFHTQFNFSGMMRTGRESVKRFSRLIASQHMHLLVVLLFPARLLLIGAFTV